MCLVGPAPEKERSAVWSSLPINSSISQLANYSVKNRREQDLSLVKSSKKSSCKGKSCQVISLLNCSRMRWGLIKPTIKTTWLMVFLGIFKISTHGKKLLKTSRKTLLYFTLSAPNNKCSNVYSKDRKWVEGVMTMLR